VRIVLDADAWVSAILLPGGTADRAVLAVLAGKATALISEPLVAAVIRVLGRNFSRDREQLARVALLLNELAEPIAPRDRVCDLSDAPDTRVLQCAVAGRADLVVTGDRAMLRLARHEGIEIVSVRAFLQRLGAEA